MKIEGNRPNVDQATAGKVESARTASAKGKDRAGKTHGDAVTVSPDVQLAQRAIDSASQPASVRPEAVSRGKALLASGSLGSDPAKLADTLIQRMLDNQG
jgi:flagellar biosynthesis anti-sigma factor FlgM